MNEVNVFVSVGGTATDQQESFVPAQLWSILVAVAALVAGAFALGAKLFGR